MRIRRRFALTAAILSIALGGWVTGQWIRPSRAERLTALGAFVHTAQYPHGPALVHPLTKKLPQQLWADRIRSITLYSKPSQELLSSLSLARHAELLYADESEIDDATLRLILKSLPNLLVADFANNRLTAAALSELRQTQLIDVSLDGIDATPDQLLDIGMEKRWESVVFLGAARLLQDVTSQRTRHPCETPEVSNDAFSRRGVFVRFPSLPEQVEWTLTGAEIGVLNRMPPPSELEIKGRVEPQALQQLRNKSRLVSFQANVSNLECAELASVLYEFPALSFLSFEVLSAAAWSSDDFRCLRRQQLDLSFAAGELPDHEALAEVFGPESQDISLVYESGESTNKGGPLRMHTTPKSTLQLQLQNWIMDETSIESLPDACQLLLSNCRVPWPKLSQWLMRSDEVGELAIEGFKITQQDVETLALTPGKFQLHINYDTITPVGDDLIRQQDDPRIMQQLRQQITAALTPWDEREEE